MFAPENFFDLTSFAHSELFDPGRPVWHALTHLKPYTEKCSSLERRNLIPDAMPLPRTVVLHNDISFDAAECTIHFDDATKGKLRVLKGEEELAGASVIMAGAVLVGSRIQIGKGVLIEAGAFVKSPTLLGDLTEVRQGAYIRGHCLIGKKCVVGHATEMKHSIFLDDAKAGHFAYIGDSILGNRANLGAGTKLANLRFAKGNVQIKTSQGPVDTGLQKLGAVLGDDFQSGCNSVTNPGTVVGKGSILLPNTTSPSGFHKSRSLIK